MTSPTSAFSPLRLTMRLKVPEAGAGNSTVAFSDSSATTFSSLLTRSPSALSHWPISISVIDSPTEGTFNSTAMSFCQLKVRWRHRLLHVGKGLRDEKLLVPLVNAGRAGGRAGRGGTPNAREGKLAVERLAELDAQEPPRAHVL